MIDLPGYRITSKIYESTTSLVYRARREEQEEERAVVLKVLKDNHPSREELLRYRQEYEITRSHGLEGAIEALGMERLGNTFAIVTEDFGGESLQVLTRERRLSLEECLDVGARTAESLRQIHSAGIIHKDVNPSNLVWNPHTERLKLIDFGIATRLCREEAAVEAPGALEGTLAYLSPEQTGRMNRALDYRCDFYSFGATLYELLTGRPPFHARDPLELLHCHIALEPEPPHGIDKNIPEMVSILVLKLLKKTPEERYQSARGIWADLMRCLEQLRLSGRVERFSPGAEDFSERFEIPRKLYGREREIETLRAVFDLAASTEVGKNGARSELLLVSGYSGIGKSSLVHEIYKPLTRRRGYFISGKFDQLQRGIPYSAILGALRRMIHLLLAESEAELHGWCRDLLGSLGSTLGVMIQAIPELGLITGPQPEPPALDPVEAQNRFHLSFRKLIGVFARPEHPLVIFLDDLQWADGASLGLLELLLTGAPIRNLLIIGAYRDNEVSLTHPLSLMLDEARKGGAGITSIVLSPLNLQDTNRLISETLNRSPRETLPLAGLVFAKTGGNPFFAAELLKSIHRSGLLVFDHERRGWIWDHEGIEELKASGGIAELLLERIHGLGARAREVLKLSSCIGNHFDLKTLVIVSRQPEREIVSCLGGLIAQCLVFPVGKGHRAAELEAGGPLDFGLSAQYRFAHDRVQQAAYSLIPEEARKEVHLEAGRSLRSSLPPSQQEERLFEIVAHLNLGADLMDTRRERLDLARLNLEAGQRARSSAAFERTFGYFKAGMDLLGKRCWEEEPELALDLHIHGAEAASLCTDYAEMERLVEVALRHAGTLLDKTRVYEIKIQAYAVQNRLAESLDFALPVLEALGFPLPRKPRKIHILWEWLKLELSLMGKRLEDLGDLPEMTDPRYLAAFRIGERIGPAIRFASPLLAPLVAIKAIALSLKHGAAGSLAYACMAYAVILLGLAGSHEKAFRFVGICERLLNRFGDRATRLHVGHISNVFIKHLKDHAAETILPLQKLYQEALECGDLLHASYEAIMRVDHMLLTGWDLRVLTRDLALYDDDLANLKLAKPLRIMALYRQVLINLTGESENPVSLIGSAFNEEQRVEGDGVTDFPILLRLHSSKLILACLFNSYPEAIESSREVEKLMESAISKVGSNLLLRFYLFYDSLAQLGVYSESTRGERRAILKRVDRNLGRMKKWADWAPANYLHKLALVEAGRAAVLGRNERASGAFDEAIEVAGKEGYINEQAMANERAALFYLGRGKKTVAGAYLSEARYLYGRWGASAKVRDLDEAYGSLLSGRSHPSAPETTPLGMLSTLSTPPGTDDDTLDLASILKASQAISSEITLARLLSRLILIAIENAGAQRGLLAINSEGLLLIEAEGWVGREDALVLQSRPVESCPDFPASIIRYAARTGESLILEDASRDSRFTEDPYIAKASPQSILCLPLIRQGSMVGVLYMENNLTPDAFTEDRLRTLELLCAQAAISIENAKLYERLEDYSHTLEEKAAERTASLEKAMMELQCLAKLDGLTQIANRRRFDEYLEQEWSRSCRDSSPLSFILCDVDHFKLFNDTYGHQAGDDCLRSIAAAISACARRPADLAARYGGEEFALILPNTDIEGALQVAESLRREINRLAIPHSRSTAADHVTLSMGASGVIPGRSTSPEALIELADEALYAAKAGGRDQVVTRTSRDRVSC